MPPPGIPRHGAGEHRRGREPDAPAGRRGRHRPHARRHGARRRRGPRGVHRARQAEGARADLPQLRAGGRVRELGDPHARRPRGQARERRVARVRHGGDRRARPRAGADRLAHGHQARAARRGRVGRARSRTASLDAFFWSGGLPTSAVSDLTRARPVTMLDLRALARPLRQRYGGVYEDAAIPAGTYPGVARRGADDLDPQLHRGERDDERRARARPHRAALQARQGARRGASGVRGTSTRPAPSR